MRSLLILSFMVLLTACKQDVEKTINLKEKGPSTNVPSDLRTIDSSTEPDNNEPPKESFPNEADLESHLSQLKEDIFKSLDVLGEEGTWKLKFIINGKKAKVDTDLLFKFRFTNLDFLPKNQAKLIFDLEELREKLLIWREEYSGVGELASFKKENDIFESYLTLFNKGSEDLAKKIVFETDNYFQICSLGNRGLEDERYFPIISLKRIFPEKSCQELYQFYNSEGKSIRLEAGYDYHFTNIQAIRGFYKITDLILRGSDKSLLDGELDISILKEMKYLEFFESGYNRIRDFSPLASLKRLSYISVYPIEEFKYIKVCPTDSENKTLNEFCKKAGFSK